MKHLDELTLLALAKNELTSVSKKSATMHLEQCTDCKKKLQLIQVTIAPQKPREPSKDILSDILHYHSQMQSIKMSFIQKMYHYIQLHRRPLALSLGIVIGIAIALFTKLPDSGSIPHILYIPDASRSKFHTKTLNEGHRIIIQENSTAMLFANNDIRFQLNAGADITITRSYFNSSLSRKTYIYEIYGGIVNVKSFASHQSMHYELKTPDALIQPSGTEFYVNVSSEGTHIYIVEGSVILHNTATHEAIEAEAGKLYTITKHNITYFDIAKYELQWIHDFDMSFKDLSDNIDFGEYSAIHSNINDNTGKECSTKANLEKDSLPFSNEDTESLKNKNDIKDMKELKNEMRQLKKESKHKQGK